ncbi:hypothetical protein DH09_03875 [Bacillaceae bacterium JMAK1]|nr:hypothetical protein DH09_03875 [Bacillaceae bacterium JMAK1]
MGKSRHRWNGCSCREDRNDDRKSDCGKDDNVFESGYQKPAPPWYPTQRDSRPDHDYGRKPEKEKSRSRLRGTIYISCDR